VLARVAAALASAEADITHINMGQEAAQDATDLRFVIAVRDRRTWSRHCATCAHGIGVARQRILPMRQLTRPGPGAG
jgi:hypothetical protein